MTIIKHELKQNGVSLGVWTAAIGFLFAICIFIFPELKGQMDGVSDMFASMGSFTEAFGLDKVSFGSLLGFYSVELGNILGIGGALFAALCAVTALAKEEKEHTAEFLLTHPISRVRIITEKLISVMLQIIILNIAVYCIAIAAIAAIGEDIPRKEITLLHLAFLLLQIEIAGICFGISAFLRRSGMSIGLGVAVTMYFLNIIANITDKVSFLRYITPFAYAEGTEIVSEGSLDWGLVLLGMLYCAVGIAAAYIKYRKKDIV
ncbi:MAG: ABC transporter permease subunit [Oscillospiraceae bacterium]